ncbi:MAG: hypothetical protein LUC24_05635 [Bacteroidales bacterium]|nr:hypothetical protein [Bacteroidales bacterium]
MKAIFGKIILVLLPALFFSVFNAAAQNQQQDPPNFEELAENEADRLCELLDLNDYQLFYVDSTLKHDWVAMNDEFTQLQMSKVTNSSLYISIQDKWMEAIDESYRKIFNDEQWEAYLKSGAAKNQRAREKRKEKADKALEK